MKISLRSSHPPASVPGKLERAATAAVDVAPIDNQLALVAPRSHKTRSAVESWLKTLFVSSKSSSSSSRHGESKRRKELRRRASTGSLFENSGAAAAHGAEPPRLKRASSLFSPHTEDKENQQSNASPSEALPAKSATRSKRADEKLWLKPVASFPEAFDRVGAPEQLLLVPSSLPVSATQASTAMNSYAVSDPLPLEPALELFAYVVPPVEMPNTYRIQDRRGGMIVAGRVVLFTNAAFKRRLRNLSQLRAIPEHHVAPQLDAQLDAYLYGVQHFGAASRTQSMEPLSQWI